MTAPALVLGSTQPEPAGVVDGRIGEVEVVRRGSGGGAVLLRPDETLWVDVVVPAGDPLWSDDVARAFWWLGETWVRALAFGDVHRGAMVRTTWSGAVCFAGVGAGEVVARRAAGDLPVPGGGGKVVGIAARRTRDWALFQCAVPFAWHPDAYVRLLGLAPEAADELAGVAAPVADCTAADVTHAFLAALPD